MKRQRSPKQLNAAIWLLAVVPVGVLILWIRHQYTNGVGGLERWLKTLPVSLVLSLAMFAVLAGLLRKHRQQEVRGATTRTAKVIGPLALILLLILIFGIPLFSLWLGGSFWGG